MQKKPNCTCRDTACPNHPSNHDQGCTLCIAKNRKQGEIPVCFFNEVGRPEGMKDYFYHDFAECVRLKEQQK